MKSMPMRGQRTATNKAKKANPFANGAPMKMAPTKKAPAKMGAKAQPGMKMGMKK